MSNGAHEGKAKEPDCDVSTDRTLKDHTFMFPAFVSSPFVPTYVATSLRASALGAPDTPTDFGLADLDITAIREAVDLQIKAADWLAIQANANGRALFGTSRQSIVYVGTSYGYGLGLGALFRLVRLNSSGSQVSIRAFATYTNGETASLRPLFASANAAVALRSVVLDSPGQVLVVPLHGWTYMGLITAAQTLSPIFGLQIEGGLGGSSLTLNPFNTNIGAREEATTNGFNFRVGVAVDANFQASNVPIAVVGEWEMAREATASDLVGATVLDVQHTAAIDLLYSGRPNFQAGIVAGWTFGIQPIGTPNGVSGRPDSKLVELTMRYIW